MKCKICLKPLPLSKYYTGIKAQEDHLERILEIETTKKSDKKNISGFILICHDCVKKELKKTTDIDTV